MAMERCLRDRGWAWVAFKPRPAQALSEPMHVMHPDAAAIRGSSNHRRGFKVFCVSS